MKTLYLTDNGSNIFVNPETNECGRIESQRESINRLYLIDEPMHVTFQAGEYKKEFDVVPNDIVVVFYSGVTGGFKHRIIVAKSEEWVENLRIYNEEEQKRREEWAKKQAECDGASCCDECNLKQG